MNAEACLLISALVEFDAVLLDEAEPSLKESLTLVDIAVAVTIDKESRDCH